MRFKVPSPLVTGALVGFIVVGSGVGIWRTVRTLRPCSTVTVAPNVAMATTSRVSVSPAKAMVATKRVEVLLTVRKNGVPFYPSTSSTMVSSCTSATTLKAPFYWDGAKFYVQTDEGDKRPILEPSKTYFKNGSATFDCSLRVEIIRSNGGFSSWISSRAVTVERGVPQML